MKEEWLKQVARFDALQARERGWLAAAILGGVIMLGFSLFIEPAMTRARLAERAMSEQQVQIASVQAQIQALQSPAQDPDVAARAELSRLKKELGELASRLSALEKSLVPSRRMAGLLEDMIGRKSALRLLSLKTLPVAPLLDKKTEKTAMDESSAPKAAEPQPNQSAGLFKHGIEIKIEGSYQDLMAYLERLEKEKLKLLWSNVSLYADKHPKLVLTLTVFTLSLDRAWLIV
jgi:MSHA biogenesis protein MshJ